MRVGLGTSTRLDEAGAAREAALRARRQLGGRSPEAAIVVATAAWGAGALPTVIDAVAAEMGTEAFVGGSVDGLLAGEGWVAHRPGIAVLALADATAEVLHAEGLAGDEDRAGAELLAGASAPPGPDDLLILFADSLSLAPTALLAGIADALPGLPVVGLGASEPEGGQPLVWAGGDAAGESCAGLLVRGRRPPLLAVTTACRPRSPELPVTRARGNWVLGLAGRPALDVLREHVPEQAAGGTTLAGLAANGASAHPLDGPVVRNLVGFDEERAAFALPEPVRSGTGLTLMALDPDAARRDLEQRLAPALDARRPEAAAFGLYLTCRAAGHLLLDAALCDRALAQALGGGPMLGLSSAFQLAPTPPGAPGPATRLHTYSGVLALVGESDPAPSG